MNRKKNILLTALVLILGMCVCFASANAVPDNRGEPSITVLWCVIIAAVSIAVAFIVVYAMLPLLDKIKLPDKIAELITDKVRKMIYAVLACVLAALLTAGSIALSVFLAESFVSMKDTKKSDISRGTIVNETDISLDDYNENITITKGGEYTLSGSIAHTVLIDADDRVTLNLNNVNITGDITSAVTNVGNEELVVNLPKGTVNTLTDSGYSTSDGCLYSDGNLFIRGEGILNVFGKQQEGEGISTKNCDITIDGGIINIESNDDGFNVGGDGGVLTINGGTIDVKAGGDGLDSNGTIVINGGVVSTVGSGSGGNSGIDAENGYTINGGNIVIFGAGKTDMPQSGSAQKYLCFNISETVQSGEMLTLCDAEENEVFSFEMKNPADCIIISCAELDDGTYFIKDANSEVIVTAK